MDYLVFCFILLVFYALFITIFDIKFLKDRVDFIREQNEILSKKVHELELKEIRRK